MVPFLPVDRITQSFEPELTEALGRVVRSGWFLRGGEVKRFEESFASYVGTAYCVGVANGLDALTLSLLALKKLNKWQDGDEVVVPCMTFVATALAVCSAGLRPVLADVDENALLTSATARKVLSSRTRVLLPVHLYGQTAPLDELKVLADAEGLLILEDAAQAHGARCGSALAGSLGTAAAFSFYPGKNLGALGDGGAVTTNNPQLAQLIRTLANYGAEQKYLHTEVGLNSRLDEIQAAVLTLKLQRLDADNQRRKAVAAQYAKLICNPKVKLPFGGEISRSIFHIYPLRCERREDLRKFLSECGVQTQIHYPFTLAEQPALRSRLGLSEEKEPEKSFPGATLWAREELSLPIHPLLTEKEIHQVADAVNAF